MEFMAFFYEPDFVLMFMYQKDYKPFNLYKEKSWARVSPCKGEVVEAKQKKKKEKLINVMTERPGEK